MNGWPTARDQWLRWYEDDNRAAAAQLRVQPLDHLDAQVCQILRIDAVGAQIPDEAATSVGQSFEEMPTVVRPAPTAPRDSGDSSPNRSGLEFVVAEMGATEMPEGHGQASPVPVVAASDGETVEDPTLAEAEGLARAGAPSTTLEVELESVPQDGESESWHIPALTTVAEAFGPALQPPEVVQGDGTTPSHRAPIEAEGASAGTDPGGAILVPLEPPVGAARAAGEIVTQGGRFADAPEPAPPDSGSGKIVVAAGLAEVHEPAPTTTLRTAAEAIDPLDSGITEIDADVLEPEDAVEPEEAPSPASAPPPAPKTEGPPPLPRGSDGPNGGKTMPRGVAPLTPAFGAADEGAGRWGELVFAEFLPELCRFEPVRIAMLEAQFVSELTGVAAGASLLDVGCGSGHHARAFAARGLRVVGLDASSGHVEAARAADKDQAVRWIHGDVRGFAEPGSFDLVACVGTTLGQYDDPQTLDILRAMHGLCRAGGQIVIQVMNRDYVVGRLPTRSWWQGDGCLVLDEVDWDPRASRVVVQRTLVCEDGRQLVQSYAVRAYALHELEAMFGAAGLGLRHVSGSRHLPGRFYAPTSREMWVVASAL